MTFGRMKKSLEEEKKGREEEKRKMEERIRNLELEVNEMKHLKEESFPVIKSLSQFKLHLSDSSKLTVQGNTITHVGTTSQEMCIFTDTLKTVCIMSSQ